MRQSTVWLQTGRRQVKPQVHYPDAVADAVKQAGFDPYEQKLLGITAMQKLLGKIRFDELLSAWIEKPAGKPALVPKDDKRTALFTAKNKHLLSPTLTKPSCADSSNPFS
ncbi:DUF2800 domain-containing protein [Canibacter sp. lx-72]|nr:DUF2800 domain-containing protein [Canibacter zhuwentaonis]